MESKLDKVKRNAVMYPLQCLNRLGADEEMIATVQQSITAWVEAAYRDGQHSTFEAFDKKINQCYEGFNQILRGEGNSVL